MITKTVVNYKPQVGMMSCVGIGVGGPLEYPLSFGNYMSLLEGPYIANMWAENIEEITLRQKLTDIEVTEFSNGSHTIGLITDKRVPKEWLIQDKLCVTGHGWGSRELCETILEFCGYSTENHICGCEMPDQTPLIYQTCSFDRSTQDTYTCSCSNCHRSWSDGS